MSVDMKDYLAYQEGYEAGKRDAASPWHRVEDGLPKPHRDVLVSGMEAINNSRVYKVMVNDNGTWRPTDYAPSIRWDYWMSIEPPKEENKEGFVALAIKETERSEE